MVPPAREAYRPLFRSPSVFVPLQVPFFEDLEAVLGKIETPYPDAGLGTSSGTLIDYVPLE